MQISQLLLSLASVSLVAALPQGTAEKGSTSSSIATPNTVITPTGASTSVFHIMTGTGTGTGSSLQYAATDAPYYPKNGTFLEQMSAILAHMHASGASTSTTLSTVTTSIQASSTSTKTTSTTSSSTTTPTGRWNDGNSDLDADQFSIMILPGTKSVLVQTVTSNGNTVPYIPLSCPDDGDSFEAITGKTFTLPWYLLLHGGNVCSGSWKPSADFDNAWIKYSNLEQINIPSSSRCSSVGDSMRCVLPVDPTKG